MSVDASETTEATTPEVLVSRQPVCDRRRRVFGYQIAYAPGGYTTQDWAQQGDASAHLFHDVLSLIGLEELVGNSVASLPISREFLLAIGVPPVRPDRVLLRIGHDEACDPQLDDVLERLTMRGYSLSLCDLPGPDFSARLLERFGAVEIDLTAWPESDVRAVVPRILAERAMPFATEVHNQYGFEWARDLGFERFVGPFYAAPAVIATHDVPVDRIGAVAQLAQLLDGRNASVEPLEEIIERDVGLSVKLLRYINSAYFGLSTTIHSIRQAVMMLGVAGVARWALLVALTGGPNTPRELCVIALTRARMCELIGARLTDVAPEDLFTIGLLSTADALLGAPLEAVLHELPLADETSRALLLHAGPAGGVLQAVLAYERGHFEAPSIDAVRTRLLADYRESLQWATETLSTLI